jgi:hypothetical protein
MIDWGACRRKRAAYPWWNNQLMNDTIAKSTNAHPILGQLGSMRGAQQERFPKNLGLILFFSRSRQRRISHGEEERFRRVLRPAAACTDRTAIQVEYRKRSL